MSAKCSVFLLTAKTARLRKVLKRLYTFGLALFLALAFFMPVLAAPVPESALSRAAIERHASDIKAAMAEEGLTLGAPVFIRIIKNSDKGGHLELFVENTQGAFVQFKSWDICTVSGGLGPKMKTGDRQAPEGFYFVKPNMMNPWSQYHLSFNLGYPNAFDRAHGRTGKYLMVHGDCVSIGCYAMTDDGIEEIYTIVSAAMEGGQSFVRVHAFPFPMTDVNLARKSNSDHAEFWQNLKTGWDWFEANKRPPNVEVRNKRYVFD